MPRILSSSSLNRIFVAIHEVDSLLTALLASSAPEKHPVSVLYENTINTHSGRHQGFTKVRYSTVGITYGYLGAFHVMPYPLYEDAYS